MTTAAVIGCGDVSPVHLDALAGLPGVELVGVCDVDPDRAAAAGARWAVPAFADHRELLARLRPAVAHVCTPHHRHAQVAIDCLRAGVHVLVEKPLAHTPAEADRVIAAARARPDVKLAVCLQNRYNAPVRALRALLGSGELGAVRGGSATVFWHREPGYYRARPWRGRRGDSGGGVLINQAIHTLDLMQWLLGDVTAVRGHTGRYVLDDTVDVEDTAQVFLEHAGGARSVLAATLGGVADSPVTLEVVTDRATLFLRHDLAVEYADGARRVIAQPAVDTPGRPYWGASHALLIADFYRRLSEPAAFWLGPEEGAKSLRIVAQAYANG